MAGRPTTRKHRSHARSRFIDKDEARMARRRRQTIVGKGNGASHVGSEILRALRRHSPLRNFSADTIAQIASLTSLEQYAENELIRTKLDDASCLYCVVSGGIRVRLASADGREPSCAFMKAGSWFRPGMFFDGPARSHDMRACRETVLATIEHRDFHHLLESQPILYKHFARHLRELVGPAHQATEEDVPTTAQARFAKRLVSLADLHGVPYRDGTLIQCPMPQQDLALTLRVARRTVDEKLVEWQRLRWVDLQCGRIIVLNRAALEQVYNEH